MDFAGNDNSGPCEWHYVISHEVYCGFQGRFCISRFIRQSSCTCCFNEPGIHKDDPFTIIPMCMAVRCIAQF